MKAKIGSNLIRRRSSREGWKRSIQRWNLSTRTLQAEIYIPNPNRFLKPGMFANVEIVLLEKPQTLVIPREAVLESRKRNVCFCG